MSGNIFNYPNTTSEVMSPMSTKSLSPGTSRPSKTIVAHSRSLSDSKILAAALGHEVPQMDNHLSPYIRYKGFENLHELNYSSDLLNANNQGAASNLRGIHDDSDPDDYLDPDPGSQSGGDFKPNSESLTYLTANDLMNHSDEEESVGIVSDSPSNDSYFREHNGSVNTQKRYEPYNPNIISPSDQEVMTINFPGQDKVTFKQIRQLAKAPESPERDLNVNITNGKTEPVQVYPQRTRNVARGSDDQRHNNKASMSSVPDIIPYGRKDICVDSPDSDDQEVFII